MSNSLGSSGLNSGSTSSAIERTERLLLALMRFKVGTLNLDVRVKAETVARNAMRKRAMDDCMVDVLINMILSGLRSQLDNVIQVFIGHTKCV